jgi:hypothetical protein
MTRPYTDRLLEMIEDGMLDRDTVIMACVKYMSEQDVQDMMEINEFILEPDAGSTEYKELSIFDANC